MDLDAYLDRIGHAGDRVASLGTLSAIVTSHAASIPFEAIDVLLGKGVDTAPEAVFNKLVTRRRGGYCFEQNGLMMRSLAALGFSVEPRLARVLWMRPADAPPARATHMALKVRIDGRDWLADAGFGNGTPTAPLAFDTSEQHTTPLETFRLHPTADGHVLEISISGKWAPVYEIIDQVPSQAALAEANLFTSTHPESRFVRDLILARATTEARFLLLGNRLMTRRAKGGADVRTFESAEDLAGALGTVFGLDVPIDWHPLLERFVHPEGEAAR